MSVMTLVFLIVMAIGVAIPVANDTISEANLSGTSSTLADFIPVFLIIAVLAVTAKLGGF